MSSGAVQDEQEWIVGEAAGLVSQRQTGLQMKRHA
jgi:hypothetical protein